MRSNRLELEGRRYLFVNSIDWVFASVVAADPNNNTVGRATDPIPPRFYKIQPLPVDTRFHPGSNKNWDQPVLLVDVGLLQNSRLPDVGSWEEAKLKFKMLLFKTKIKDSSK